MDDKTHLGTMLHIIKYKTNVHWHCVQRTVGFIVLVWDLFL